MSARDAAADVLGAASVKFGFIPDLFREMARSPAVARVYLRGQEAMAEASLSAPERQVVQLLKTISNYVNHIAHTPVDPAFRE